MGRGWERALRGVLRSGEETEKLLRRLAMGPLPRLLLLRDGVGAEVPLPQHVRPNSSLEPQRLVDIVASLSPPSPPATTAVLTLTWNNFTRTTKQHQLLLVAFTTSWCRRCAELAPQLQRAAQLLHALQPALPVTIGVFEVQGPQTAPLLEQLGVVSFPVGKLYSHGRFLSSYQGGISAPEIAQELMREADKIARDQGQKP